MHKKCSWKLRKISCSVKLTETNSCQWFHILRVNFWLMYMSVTTKITVVIYNKSTLGRFQSSTWKWSFDSSNAFCFRLMKIIPEWVEHTKYLDCTVNSPFTSLKGDFTSHKGLLYSWKGIPRIITCATCIRSCFSSPSPITSLDFLFLSIRSAKLPPEKKSNKWYGVSILWRTVGIFAT